MTKTEKLSAKAILLTIMKQLSEPFFSVRNEIWG